MLARMISVPDPRSLSSLRVQPRAADGDAFRVRSLPGDLRALGNGRTRQAIGRGRLVGARCVASDRLPPLGLVRAWCRLHTRELRPHPPRSSTKRAALASDARGESGNGWAESRTCDLRGKDARPRTELEVPCGGCAFEVSLARSELLASPSIAARRIAGRCSAPSRGAPAREASQGGGSTIDI